MWALILLVAQRRLDPQMRKTLQVTCAGWWSGWTSATIARIGYPPPKELGPRAKKTLERVSLALVAVGLVNVIRLLITGGRAAASKAP